MKRACRIPQRLVRWTSLCVCFALVLTSLAVLPFTSANAGRFRAARTTDPIQAPGNGQQQTVSPPKLLTGPPPGIVPNLDDMRRASEQDRRNGGRRVHAPDPVPSTGKRWGHGSGTGVGSQGPGVGRANYIESSAKFSALSAVKANHARSTRSLPRAVLYPPQGTDDMAMARIDPHNRTGTGGVDPLSNNFNWSLGLVGLKGRGLDLGLTLSYNSLATWTKSSSNWIDFDVEQSSPSPGFRLGFPVVQGPYYHNVASTYFYILITPSGQRVELRQISASVFQAVDASYSQLTVYSGYLIFRAQGAQLKFYPNPTYTDYHCTEIKDRNGNYLTIAYNGVGEISTVTDTLGRVVTFVYDGYNNIKEIDQTWNGQSPPHQWATFGWSTTLIGNNFSPSLNYVGPTPGTSIQVLAWVGLPDGSKYYFDYDGSYGVVTKVRYYAQSGNQRRQTTYTFNFTNSDSPRVTAERDWAASWNGDTDEVPASAEEAVTTYTHDGDGGCRVTFPDGTVDKEYYGTGWQSGLTTETKNYETVADANADYDQNRNCQPSTWKKCMTVSWAQDNMSVSYLLNPRAVETNIWDSAGNRKRTTTSYDTNWSLPTFIAEYAADGATQIRHTFIGYNLNQQYLDQRIIGLVSSVHRSDTVWWQSKVYYYYDDTSLQATATTVQHDGSFGTSSLARGNLTSVQRWDTTSWDTINDSTRTLTSHTGYDTNGSPVWSSDPLGHTSSVSYTDSFSDNTNHNTLAYPTTATDADGYSSTAQYNFDFGAVTHTQGPPTQGSQGLTSGASQNLYYDDAGRLQWVTRPGGFWHYFWYAPRGDAVVEQVSLTQAPESRWSIAVVDGADRHRLSGTELPNSTGGYAGAFTLYDNMGRVSQQYNPAETNGIWVPVGDDAAGWSWTSQTYDWKGRPLVTTNQDNTTKSASYGGCGCAGGEVVTLTDEVGRRQRVSSDSLGRQWKTEVLNWDGSVYSTTTNTFNARDQVTLVRQTDNATGAYQDTTMSYDGYGRLQSKHVPEQDAGTATTYSYNNDYTLNSLTDARGASATYGYNNRHQVTSINYNAPAGITPTANVTFGYDAEGNRTSMTDGLGSVSYVYDSLSRVKSETRTFNGVGTYALNYEYNLGGELTSLTDPFNAQVGYNHDNTGRVSSVTGAGYANVATYASNLQYRAWGATKHLDYGNSLKLDETYNGRLLKTQFDVTNSGGSRVAGWQYQYGNDGRLSYSHDLRDNRLDRAYTYDHAAQLMLGLSGSEAQGNFAYPYTGPYKQTYGFDVWGNLTDRSMRIHGYMGYPSTSYYHDNYVNNRNTGGSSSQPWVYDADGRLTNDRTRQYSFDAAGNEISNSQNSIYRSFDGDGQMLKKTESGGVTYYLRSSVLKEVINELNQYGQKQRGYVYREGEVLAKEEGAQVLWNHDEPSGTSSQWSNASGTTTNRVEKDPLETQVDENGGFSGGGFSMNTIGFYGNPNDMGTGCASGFAGLACTLRSRSLTLAWRSALTFGFDSTTTHVLWLDSNGRIQERTIAGGQPGYSAGGYSYNYAIWTTTTHVFLPSGSLGGIGPVGPSGPAGPEPPQNPGTVTVSYQIPPMEQVGCPHEEAESASGRGNNVILNYADGTREVRHGGSRSWRNNNPGNIRPGYLQGEIGKAGGFTIFSSESRGQSAIVENLLTGPAYQGQTINGAVEAWAPPRENNTAAYQARLQDLTGLNGDTLLSDLNQAQLESVANAIRTIEGWTPGTSTCWRQRTQ